MEPFIGQLLLVGFNFAPRGYAFCDGQLMSIAQNTALFSLLGTMYGGNGQTTFGLPDLRGRVPIHRGQGPGLPAYTQGEMGGTPNVTLSVSNIPVHNHALMAVSELGDTGAPGGAYLANSGSLDTEYRASGTTVAMNSGAIGTAGGNQPFPTMPPYLTLNYVIATEGIFPTRN